MTNNPDALILTILGNCEYSHPSLPFSALCKEFLLPFNIWSYSKVEFRHQYRLVVLSSSALLLAQKNNHVHGNFFRVQFVPFSFHGFYIIDVNSYKPLAHVIDDVFIIFNRSCVRYWWIMLVLKSSS